MTLRVVTEEPYNAEAALRSLAAPITPVGEFYVRNNFTMPRLDPAQWRLRVRGNVRRALDLSLRELMQLPALTRRVTLECAGNGRALLDRPVDGTPWRLGAAGTAEFTGVHLRDVLARAGVEEPAVECVFTGADGGFVAERGHISFQRSLPLHVACGERPLLAWAMNGAPLTQEHGFPLRLVVPGWYAVASVKWLVDIEVVPQPFDGHFQQDRYVYRGDGAAPCPVTLMRVRSLLTSHADGDVVPPGRVRLTGVAWSGAAPVERVTLLHSRAEATSSHEARLEPGGVAGVASRWECSLDLEPGMATIAVHAVDATGAAQPEQPAWNELGYGNNVAQSITLRVAARD